MGKKAWLAAKEHKDLKKGTEKRGNGSFARRTEEGEAERKRRKVQKLLRT
jgi:hypothetical protein